MKYYFHPTYHLGISVKYIEQLEINSFGQVSFVLCDTGFEF